MNKILLTGANGQVGCELVNVFSAEKEISLFPFSKADLNIVDPHLIDKKIDEINPDMVINCAAYTAVDKAEEEETLAYSINKAGAGNIAASCKQNNIPLIHFSTDYVYHGKEGKPLPESSPLNPQGVYAKSKMAGELAIRDIGCDCLIIRSSWIFSPFGKMESVA